MTCEREQLLAMQKVVGSNPISRFRKSPHLQVFFRVIGWVVRLRSWGLIADWRGGLRWYCSEGPCLQAFCDDSNR